VVADLRRVATIGPNSPIRCEIRPCVGSRACPAQPLHGGSRAPSPSRARRQYQKCTSAIVVARVEPVVFSREERRRILEQGDAHEYLARPLKLALYAGLSISDIRTLDWKEVSLRRQDIRRQRSKTRQAIETPLHRDLRAELMSTPKAERRGRVCAYVPASESSLRQELRRLLKRAKVSPAPRCHNGWRRFRHTFATRLVESGATLPDVRALLGHHPTSTVTLRYFHTDAGRLREAVERAFQ